MHVSDRLIPRFRHLRHPSPRLDAGARLATVVRITLHFARVHQTLRVTPAMEAGIADHVWSVEEIVGLSER